MTLNQFIKETLQAYSLKFEEQDVERYIYRKAREECKGSSIAIDDETIKEWILNYDPAKEPKTEPAPKAEVKAVELKPKPAPKPKKEKKNDEQISIFDLL